MNSEKETNNNEPQCRQALRFIVIVYNCEPIPNKKILTFQKSMVQYDKLLQQLERMTRT